MKRIQNINKLIRISVILGCIGLFCMLLFLIYGFEAWSVGIGMFLGFPILMVALVIYIIAVIKDLKKHEVIRD